MTIQGEGAEKMGEVEILRAFGCDLVQGYVFAHPSSAAEALTFARACAASPVYPPAETAEEAIQSAVKRLRTAAA